MKKNLLIAVLSLALLGSLLFPRRPAAVPEPPPVREAAVVPPPSEMPVPEQQPPPPVSPPDRFAPIVAALHEAAQTPGLLGAPLGFCLIDGAGKVVVNLNAETAFIPASTLKVVTTTTALQRLGPDFQFSTRLLGTVPVSAGVLAGDLVIAGEADPLLSLEDVAGWAASLKKLGLNEVRGRIIGDGRFLQGSLYADFWNWGDIGNGYGSAVCGLNLEHNRFTVTFRGADVEGGPAPVSSLLPEVPAVKMVNEVTTGAPGSGDNVVIHGGERTGLVTFRGTVPPGRETAIIGAVPDPELFAAHHFRQALIAAGIAVKGAAVSMHSLGGNPVKAEVELLRHSSPPLLKLITSIHATSDNHETECLFRRMGLLANQPPDVVIREHWKAQGLEFSGLRMVDGCGLARADHIRPLDLARLQYLAARGPHGAAYLASLLSDGPVRWKGGAMSSIRSSTGYITTGPGEVFCFTLMVNHYSDSKSVSELRRIVFDLISRLQP